jgi:hypothetical protein
MAAELALGLGGSHRDERTTVEWWTPPHVFDALGLRFDLDPCAPPLPAASWIPAARRYSVADDGLAQPWTGRVWLNPPYGREAGRWVDRLADHGDGVALVFARTCARWAHRAMRRADLVCMVAGRLRFIDGRTGEPPDNAAAPSMLLAYGPECARAVAASRLGLALAPAPTEGEKHGDR